MKEILKVENIYKSYDRDLFINLSLSIKEGSVNGILLSGNSGKTTLIRLLSGIDYVDSGKIYIDNIEVCKKNLGKFAVRISTILDDIDNQFICNKVVEELKYPLENLNVEDHIIEKRVEEVANLVDIKLILGKDTNRLTYFEKVKVLLGASIIHKPKLLFLDDIYKLLKNDEKIKIRKIIKEINKKYNMAIILVTSDLEDVIDATNITVIRDGEIFLNGMFDRIIENDNELAKMGIIIPIMVDLSMKLRFYDLIDKIYYDPDKVVEALWN